MAEFAPNLDDGELWIPSDILVSDVPISAAFPPPPPPPSPSLGIRTRREVDLARHVASLSLLQLPYSQRFVPANQYALTALSGPPPPNRPTAVFAFPSPDPVLYLQPVQADGLTRVATHPYLHSPQPSFLFPDRVSRPPNGTGVFFPRASVTGDSSRRKQGSRNRNMTQRTGAQGRGAGTEDWLYHRRHGSVPPEVKALPTDWTY